MKKVKCDFCSKDISEDYDTEINEVFAYDGKSLDLCGDCVDKYYDIRQDCGEKYIALKEKYDKKIEREMKKYFRERLKSLEV